ncbi:Uroporphyrinogen decarboxylase (URO-D) [Methanosalsum zhilinae DSM 4017]|uniref:Uroporphyrinogen decarboxylase (URO-D) n=1 Tax=Methanosalsum zhilinae (strain DSM 4017 / NBRC 107636 / OCM 62 / WeN5) TaxID=679901 RepID=F7XLA3_METZD|nr:methylcobamide--CoM methyltransferase [Methanosalsum zhilinae]AEH60760.1 Uroporphyrinogen decarboxylase (URO-D) [Methanosalsum zhilinae DSM 4017]
MIDEMSSKERFINALNGKETDRVPYGYLWFGAGNNVLRQMDATMDDVYRSASGIAQAQILARKMYHHDNVMAPWGCLLVEAEALGTKIKLKSNGYPVIAEYALNSADEFAGVDPDIINSSERIETIKEAISILKKEIGDEVFIAGSMMSPLMLAHQLIKGDQMYYDLIQNPDSFHSLLDILTHSCILFADCLLESGADGVFVENGGSTADLFSPEMANEFGTYYTKKLYSHVQKNHGYVISHNCAVHAFYDQEMDLKPDALNFAFGDVKSLKNKYGVECEKLHNHKNMGCKQRYCFNDLRNMMNKDICLMGNITPGVFFSDSDKDIKFEVDSCLNNADKNRFILSTGCEIPLNTPLEKMDELWRVINSHWL